MPHDKADVLIYTSNDEVGLKDVPYHFSPGERSLYTGADGSLGEVQRAGWLAIQAEEFPGWYDAQVISVTSLSGSGFDSAFEVKRNFNYPLQEDGWIWFPAMPRHVETFQD